MIDRFEELLKELSVRIGHPFASRQKRRMQA